jgi:hypothetical protein
MSAKCDDVKKFFSHHQPSAICSVSCLILQLHPQIVERSFSLCSLFIESKSLSPDFAHRYEHARYDTQESIKYALSLSYSRAFFFFGETSEWSMWWGKLKNWRNIHVFCCLVYIVCFLFMISMIYFFVTFTGLQGAPKKVILRFFSSYSSFLISPKWNLKN